jgi:hypothetical protein
MTCAALAQLITRRIIARAQEEQDPIAYFSRAAARVMVLSQYPVEEMEDRLLEFGREFGLLLQGIDKQILGTGPRAERGYEHGSSRNING